MRRLLALMLVIGLWLNFTPPAKALGAGLVPCGESPEFLQRAQTARASTDTRSAKDRFQYYVDNNALCGPEGLPRLIVDGRPGHLGDITLPGIAFLYIAGWIGWMGRSYIRAVKKIDGAAPESKELVIDVPLAIKCGLGGATWPVGAIKEFLSGELIAKDDEIPISPR